MIEIGGPSALATFRRQRAAIKGSDPNQDEASDHARPNFSDPHLRWAYRHGLLLHISPVCLQDDDQVVDPLHLGTMTVGIDDASQARLKRLQDAFNAVKQDYISARYSLWLASDPESPIRAHTQELSARGRFVNTLGYARWGVQTGMALGALNVATNTLDKIAGLTHLYFDTGRAPSSIYFNGMWRAKPKKGEQPQMQPELKAELQGTRNRGLLALCDLSLDVAGEKRETELKKLVGLRHTATHRFLVAHDMVVETEDEDGWMERIEWSRLLDAAVRQLARRSSIWPARSPCERRTVGPRARRCRFQTGMSRTSTPPGSRNAIGGRGTRESQRSLTRGCPRPTCLGSGPPLRGLRLLRYAACVDHRVGQPKPTGG